MLGLGMLLGIGWMQAVAGAYLTFLWLPVTPEKIVTTIIAMFLLKLFFPKDEKTLGVLRGLLEEMKAKHRRKANKKKRKDKKVQSSECKVQSSDTVGASIARPDEIVITRAEIDALNEYSKIVRSETIKAIFDDVEELLEARKKLECRDTNNADDYAERLKHFHAECMCVTLLIDLQKIKDKHLEETKDDNT